METITRDLEVILSDDTGPSKGKLLASSYTTQYGLPLHKTFNISDTSPSLVASQSDKDSTKEELKAQIASLKAELAKVTRQLNDTVSSQERIPLGLIAGRPNPVLATNSSLKTALPPVLSGAPVGASDDFPDPIATEKQYPRAMQFVDERFFGQQGTTSSSSLANSKGTMCPSRTLFKSDSMSSDQTMVTRPLAPSLSHDIWSTNYNSNSSPWPRHSYSLYQRGQNSSSQSLFQTQPNEPTRKILRAEGPANENTHIELTLGEDPEIFYPVTENSSETVNYRKLLERPISCNWQTIVDRILKREDQQASIFLQQKLKIATASQKQSILIAIQAKAVSLMTNRFGNFLVQRSFEYANPEQTRQLADCMKGKIVELSKDSFGCHVVQKSMDCVEYDQKCNIVNELSEQLTGSILHRYASHVWQKLFELRWESDERPNFMERVNSALRGLWTDVAKTETGSLIVQNIFENCCMQDKKDSIEEIITNLDPIIRSQWGNWVIQHMIEHADEPYREQVISAILKQASIYSVDQFASKVVEKMLKMGDPAIIGRYIDEVIIIKAGYIRLPVVDIASDAHGCYLIQYILQNGTATHLDRITVPMRKHLVSLRGSKWGARCAQMIDKSRYMDSRNTSNGKKATTGRQSEPR